MCNHVCGSSLLQMSEPSSLLFDDPASLAMRDPNWMALLGSLLAPWQPSIAAASLSSLFSPTPRGRLRSTYMYNVIHVYTLRQQSFAGTLLVYMTLCQTHFALILQLVYNYAEMVQG